MKNRTSFLLIVFALHVGVYTFASIESPLVENRPSSQSEAICRYGQVNTSLFTGGLDLSIPLYSINDPDLGLEIALQYTSEGFKPRKHSGYVGLDWFLEAGGCITREVRLYPDECNGRCEYVHSTAFLEQGMLSFIQNHPLLDKNKIFNMDPSYFQNCGSYGYNLDKNCRCDVDYLPDIFHFNFCGYHGSFMINNQGDPIVIKGDFVKVDLSGLAFRTAANASTLPEPDVTSCITIQTLDGYTYTFGGDITALEYSEALQSGQQVGEQMPPTISSWYLKSIMAPNGRKMLFYYKPFQTNSHNEKDPLWLFNEFYNIFIDIELNNSIGVDIEQRNKACRGYSFTKECILDSIVINDGPGLKIAFNNAKEEFSKRKYINPEVNLCQPNYRLNTITVKQKNKLLRTITMSYDYRSYSSKKDVSNNSYWRFLNTVHITGIGTYQLTYDHLHTYPLLDRPFYSNGLTESDSYGFYKETSLNGLLKEIVYPTGGKQCFTFATHTYGIRQIFQASGGYTNVNLRSLQETGSTSGARIAQISTYSDNNTLVEKKTFLYQTPAGRSSGVFYDWLLVKLENGTQGGLVVKDGLGYSFMNTHIGYSHVTEQTTRYPTQQIVKTTYTYYIGPSTYCSDTDLNINRKTNNKSSTTMLPILSGAFCYTSDILHRGALFSVKQYVGSQLKKESVYTYTNIHSIENLLPMYPKEFHHTALDTIVIYYNGDIPITRKLYIYPKLLEQEVITDYGQDNGMNHAIITIKLYQYDNKLRPSKTAYYDSDNLLHFTSYTYPDQYQVPQNTTSYAHGLYKLTADNRISNPVEILSGYEKNGQKYITAGMLNLYRHERLMLQRISPPLSRDSLLHIAFPTDTLIQQMEYDNKVIDKTVLELSINEPITDFAPLSLINGSLSYDTRYRKKCRYRFNQRLQTIVIDPYGKPYTLYKWEGIYPISSSTGNLITTYTYLPYVGLRSITNPQGIATWYDYDNAGRLKEVYQIIDGKKQVLNAYYYHISTE